MADNRKYYYLKLKENFFDSDSIVLLEDMKDGILYSNILLKLYLKSLKNGGKLQLDEHIPYTAQMIATLTRHQIGTVERALEIFRQLGLVEQLDSGAFYMTDIELMIGQSSTEAERKRAARLENKALLPPRTKGGHLSDIRPPEIEIELEKEIEIEKEREGDTRTSFKTPIFANIRYARVSSSKETSIIPIIFALVLDKIYLFVLRINEQTVCIAIQIVVMVYTSLDISNSIIAIIQGYEIIPTIATPTATTISFRVGLHSVIEG